MAESASRNDPFVAFRFVITIDDLPVGGFSECSGLSVEIEAKDYPEGGLNTHLRKFPGRAKQTNLTLKRGIVDRALWDWFAETAQGRVRYRNGTIAVKDPAGAETVMEWRFKRAYPTKWGGSDLNATQNNIAIESLELAHQGLERHS